MAEVTYACPYCGALTSLQREGYLADKSVTKEPLDGWAYAATTEDFSAADGVELVCLGDGDTTRDVHGDDGNPKVEPEGTARDGGSPVCGDPESGNVVATAARVGDGCGRTFYLNFVRYEKGQQVEDGTGWLEDEPSFEFLR